MLVRVLHGNSETLMCNSECAAINLLNHIRRQAGLDPSTRIDLADPTGTGITPGIIRIGLREL